MEKAPICPRCNEKHRTVNLTRKGKTYFRKYCFTCNKETRKEEGKNAKLLKKSGYKSQPRCDKCGFFGRVQGQLKIVFLDSDPSNIDRENLKTYCLNCETELLTKGKNSEYRKPILATSVYDKIKPTPDY